MGIPPSAAPIIFLLLGASCLGYALAFLAGWLPTSLIRRQPCSFRWYDFLFAPFLLPLSYLIVSTVFSSEQTAEIAGAFFWKRVCLRLHLLFIGVRY